jgi:RNA recognition motif-containing protein
MSYDYNALVESFRSHRRKAAEDTNELLQALEVIEELSQKCPMTPLLWIQYAETIESFCRSDVQAGKALKLQTLELGLAEFPGSSLLQLYHLQSLVEDNAAGGEQVETAITNAIDHVGRGSHNRSDPCVKRIYDLAVQYYAKTKQIPRLLETFVQRSHIPSEANASIVTELHALLEENQIQKDLDISSTLLAMEEGRRSEARWFRGYFRNHEDHIEENLHRDGALARVFPEVQNLEWDIIISTERNQTFAMGLGGMDSAQSFIKKAHAMLNFRRPKDSSEKDARAMENYIQNLAFAVYERGVAECPTVEALWIAYLRDLVMNIRQKDSAKSRLASVANRAVRNCPYSVSLVQSQLMSVMHLSSIQEAIVDPDLLLETIQKALDLGFLPKSPFVSLDLYITAVRVVKRRILHLLASKLSSPSYTKKPLAYDDPEALDNKKSSSVTASTSNIVIDEDAAQEVQDLLQDLKEMFEEVESRIETHSESRALLGWERAVTQSLLIDPLHHRDRLDSADTGRQSSNALDHEMTVLEILDRSIRAHNPPHPDLYAAYIRRYMLHDGASDSMECQHSWSKVVIRMRRTRYLFEKAVQAVGKTVNKDNKLPLLRQSLSSSLPLRDYESALSSLCNEWLDFERSFGSERSLAKASKIVEKKLFKVAAAAQKTDVSHTTSFISSSDKIMQIETLGEHGQEDNQSIEDVPLSKKQKTEVQNAEASAKHASMETVATLRDDPKEKNETIQPLDSLKKPGPKVRVGNMEYPAHPFTVRVSNLSLDVEDMDLVDLFRPKCGAIVHAKIIRDKHQHGGSGHKGVSKGWGLVQFEERESVDKALALNELVGLHEKLVHIEKSHMPAATLVPPGMHRVNPKGEGKVSKRNQKRRREPSNQHTIISDNKEGKKLDNHGNNVGMGMKFDQDSSKSLAEIPRDSVGETGKALERQNQSKQTSSSVLSFRPRGVVAHARKVGHPKPRLNLGTGGMNEQASEDKTK